MAESATGTEVMTVSAARELKGARSCLVGVGRPSTAAMLARRLHSSNLILVYESGTIGAKPVSVPLSIGDGELAKSAEAVVSVPEVFNYWLQGGRIDLGFLGAAQIDRFGNLNTTVIGDYRHPKVRLPGAGGAPEIAANCSRIVVIVPHSRRAFVEELDFVTSLGAAAERTIPMTIVTDLGILRGEGSDGSLILTELHPDVEVEQAREETGWELAVDDELRVTDPPSEAELEVLRSLEAPARKRANGAV
jgi:glutaconate CoA-transferase subunit B